MRSTPGQVEKLIFQLLIFLIPSNLFFHFFDNTAFIRGRLVDYLLPKIYLSDILIWSLIGYFMFTIFKSIDIKCFYKMLKKHYLVLFFLTYLFTISFISINPIAGIWYWLNIIQMLFLFIYIVKSYSLDNLIKTSYPPLVLSLVFLFLLSVYQFIFQESFLGYSLLGEATIPGSPNLVTSSFFDVQRIVPYATTPHPNVLAAMFTIFTLMIFSFSKYNPNLAYILSVRYLFIGLSLTIIIITQSFSALLGLVIGFIFLLWLSNKRLSLLSPLLFISTALLLLISLSFTYQSVTLIDLYSITRRYMLFITSKDLIFSNLITGVGLNNFIPAANLTNAITDSAIYLQPVHNIYLLWITETGLIGLIVVSWLLISKLYRNSYNSQHMYLVVPLIVLLILGLFDHYPLTLQSGLLLLCFTASLAYISLFSNNQEEGS